MTTRAEAVLHLPRYQLFPAAGQVVAACILDLFAKNGMDYMQVDDGRILRLDRIVSIDEAVCDSWDVSCALPG